MHEKICNGEEPFQYLIGTTKLQLSIVSDHAKDPHYCLRRYPPELGFPHPLAMSYASAELPGTAELRKNEYCPFLGHFELLGVF